jgi:hypothetical protein
MSYSNVIIQINFKYYLCELYYERINDYKVNITGHSVEDGPFESLEEIASFKGCGYEVDEALNQGIYYKLQRDFYIQYDLV